MATVVLIPYTPDAAETDVIVVPDGTTHHILPVFGEDRGQVTIGIITPDDTYRAITTTAIPPTHPSRWILAGPLRYVVTVRHAGANVNITP